MGLKMPRQRSPYNRATIREATLCSKFSYTSLIIYHALGLRRYYCGIQENVPEINGVLPEFEFAEGFQGVRLASSPARKIWQRPRTQTI